MKTELKLLILFLMIFMVISVGLTLHIVFLNEELTTTQNELIVTKEELMTIKGDLDVETEKSRNLIMDLETANTIIDTLKSEEYIVGFTVTQAEIEMLAKTVWGEARGCNTIEQSAVVWCILNRVDAGWGTIAEVITASGQFHGYSSNFPVTDEIKELVEDVVARWKLEKIGCGNVGRTLPSNYLYFSADDTGIGNIFRDAYSGDCNRWNWNCWNPYS